MAYAIAAIKRTAQEITEEGLQVTVSLLAVKMSTDYRQLLSFVCRVKDLRRDINLVVGVRDRGRQYTQGAERLQEAGVIVTDRRIAVLSGSTTRTVRTWFIRHPREAAQYRRVTHQVFKAHCIAQRLRWALKHQRAMGMNISISHLAEDLGWDRARVYTMFRKYPGLRAELGI